MTLGMTTDSIRCTALVRPVLAVLLVVVVLAALAVAPASAASKGCSVKNKATGLSYSTLQAAVTAANPEATLLVRGTCGGKTVIYKDMRIEGVRSRRSGEARLKAYKTPVVTIEKKARVTIASLVIAKGKGVLNRGHTTLVDVHVLGGKVKERGILNTGTLRLLGRSQVTRTRVVRNNGRLILGGTSRIIQNFGDLYDRASVMNTGIIVMNGRSVIGGNNDRCCFQGGGFLIIEAPFINKGRLVMNQRSSLTGQRAYGAVVNEGTIVMNDNSSIQHNTNGGNFSDPLGGRGGGVRNAGTLVMRDQSSIHDNTVYGGSSGVVNVETAFGGGVSNSGTLVMRDQSSIRDNAGWPHEMVKGGGVANGDQGTLIGVVCGPGGNVYGNTPDDCYFAE